MRVACKRKLSILALLILIAVPVFAAGQESADLLATANGNGTLKIGQEEFKIHSVVIKLLANGKAEINLVSEITVFVSGTWSHGDSDKAVNLQITGGGTGGGIEASGKLVLRNEGKSIERLWLQGASKTTKRNIEVNFQGQ